MTLLAVTLDPVVAFKKVAGDQVYVVAPDAVRVAVAPEQTVASDKEATVGVPMVTLTFLVLLQDPVVPVIV